MIPFPMKYIFNKIHLQMKYIFIDVHFQFGSSKEGIIEAFSAYQSLGSCCPFPYRCFRGWMIPSDTFQR